MVFNLVAASEVLKLLLLLLLLLASMDCAHTLTNSEATFQVLPGPTYTALHCTALHTHTHYACGA